MAAECSIGDPLTAAGGAEFVQAFVCTFANSITVAGLALVVWFTVSSMSYLRTGSIVMPVVYLLLLGSAALALLPVTALGIASVVLIGAGAAVVVLLLRRLDRL